MGKLNIAGVVYDNPAQVNQTTNISPLTGKVWKPSGTDSFNFTYPNGVTGIGIGGVSTGSQGTGVNSGDPQPGTFDATPVKANPILVNAQPKPLTDGGIKIPNSSVVFKSPA